MSPLKFSSPTTVKPKYCKIAKAKDKKKIAFMIMFKNLKEDINISINEIFENTNIGMK